MSGPDGSPENRHGCAVWVAGIGVLIEGPSGSGKTSLALGLVDTARARGLEAALVADDRVLLCVEGRDLIARPAPPLAGLAEIRGFGPTRVPHRPSCRLHALATLEEDGTVERLPEPAHASRLGLPLRHLRLPRRHEAGGVRIVLAFVESGPG